MKKIRSLFLSVGTLLMLSFGFGGCTSMEMKTVHIPEFNKISKAEVGENMYQKIYAYFSHDKSVKLQKPVGIKKLGVDFLPNDEFELVKLESGDIAGYSRGIYFVDNNNTGLFTYVMTSILPGLTQKYFLDEPVKYDIIAAKPEIYGADSYKKDALYQGKIGNKINISFREFYNGVARPAFTQNIEYELDANGTAVIGFQGLRMNVIKASNVDIEYVVVKGYADSL